LFHDVAHSLGIVVDVRRCRGGRRTQDGLGDAIKCFGQPAHALNGHLRHLGSLCTPLYRLNDGGALGQAELTLNGPLGLADPLLALVFDRIGDKAAAGMVDALDGKKLQ